MPPLDSGRRPLPAKRKKKRDPAPVRGSIESERGRSAERAAPARAARNSTESERARSSQRAKPARLEKQQRQSLAAPRRKKKAGSSLVEKASLLPTPGKVQQVAGGVAASLGKALYEDPTGVVKKTGVGLKEAAKGIPGAVAGAAVAAYDLAAKGDSTGAKDLLKAGADTYKTSYGDLYKASSPQQLGKAIKKNTQRIKRQGATQELLDSTLVAGGAGVGAARAVSKAAKPGTKTAKVAGKLAGDRPLLRKTVGGKAEPQKQRRTLPGAAAGAAVDAARARKQKRLVKRAKETGEALPPHRAALKPGEVAPVHAVRATAKRSAVRRGSKYGTDERTAEGLKVRRELTGRKGPRDVPGAGSARSAARALPDELRPAAKLAQQLGITGSKAGKAVLTAHLANIMRERAARPVTDSEAALRADEVADIQRLINDPSPFDAPEVKAHVATESARAERIRVSSGVIDEDRGRTARRQPQDTVLGIEPRVKDETVEAYTERLAGALNVRQGPLEPPAKYRARLHKARAAAESQGRVLPAQAYRRAGESATAYGTRLAHELDVPKMKGESTGAHRARVLDAVRLQSGELPAPRRKGESMEDFEARRADTVESAGLAEPGFVRSRYEEPGSPLPVRGLGRTRPAATSTGKSRSGELFARGQESSDPATQERHLASLIREGEQLKTESKVLEREGMRFDDRESAQAYLMRLPEKERAQWIIDEPPLVRAGLAPADGPARGDYVPTQSAWLLPVGVADELTRQRTPMNAVSAGLLRTNAGAQAVLLALSPKWFAFQVLADSATLTASGGISQILRNTREYRQLDDASRDVADIAIGGSPRSDALLQDEGVKLSVLGRAMEKSKFFQETLKGQNPATVLLRAEGARAHEFRRAALMTELRKRDLQSKMDGNIVGARAGLMILSKALAKPDPREATRLLSNADEVEAAMKHVDELMGNFNRYTALERNVARPALGFYGFLRFATRMAFWTLPVGHPIAANIAGHLGNMSAERAKDILGEDMAHQIGVWYGRKADGSVRKLDLRSASPAGSALLNFDTPAKALTLLGPAWTAALSTMLGRNLFLDAPMTIKGSSQAATNRDIGFFTSERARIGLAQALNLLPPVRALNAAYPLPESSDSLPGSRRPLFSLDPGKRAELQLETRERQREGAGARALRQLLPPGIESGSGDLNKARKAATRSLQEAVDRASKVQRMEEFLDDPDRLLEETEEEIEEIESGDDVERLMERYDEILGG